MASAEAATRTTAGVERGAAAAAGSVESGCWRGVAWLAGLLRARGAASPGLACAALGAGEGEWWELTWRPAALRRGRGGRWEGDGAGPPRRVCFGGGGLGGAFRGGGGGSAALCVPAAARAREGSTIVREDGRAEALAVLSEALEQQGEGRVEGLGFTSHVAASKWLDVPVRYVFTKSVFDFQNDERYSPRLL